MRYLQQLDASGVPIALTDHNQTHYKSVVGGCLTLIIYSLSIAYAIYIFTLWGQGQLLPKIQTETKMLEKAEFVLEQGLLKMALFNKTSEDIDPFSQIKHGYSNPTPIFSTQNRHTISIDSIKIGFTEYIQGQDFPETQYLLLFTRCDQSVLKNAGTCATQEKINSYFNQFLPFVLEIHIGLLSFDPKSQTNEKITKTQFAILEEHLTGYSQLLIKTTKQLMTNNLITDQYQEQLLINNYDMVSQQITPSRLLIDYDTLAIFFLRLDHLQIVQTIQYPKLGEVLANIGSIVSLLMLGMQITLFVNAQRLQESLIHQMIKFYYPQFHKIHIQRSWSGKIKQCYLNGKQLDVKKFSEFYQQITTHLTDKLNIINQLYEVSRIQIFILQYFDKDNIRQTKQFMLKLPGEPNDDELKGMRSPQNSISDNKPLYTESIKLN